MQADLIAEKNVGMDKDEIRKAISHVKLEYEAYHERKIEDGTGLNAVTDSSDSGEITFKIVQQENIQSQTFKL